MDISFIIPVYNAEKYVQRCVLSIFDQDFSQGTFEVIVIDDGSTDNSLLLTKQLAQEYSNILVISKENGGAASARNVGIEQASGEYLVFIDADDYFRSHSMRALVDTGKSNDLDILYYRLAIHYEDETTPDTLGGDYNGMPINNIMSGVECYKRGFQASSMCGCMVKREILFANNLRFTNRRFGEDSLLSYCITAYANRVMFLNDAPYVYFKNQGSVLQTVSVLRHLEQIEDTLGVGYDLGELSLQMKDPCLSVILKRYSINIIFGGLFEMWKSRRKINDGNALLAFMYKLEQKGWYPIKGPYFSFKKWLIARILINNKHTY